LNLLIIVKTGTLLNKNELLKHVDTDWKYYQDVNLLDELIPTYIYKVNFMNFDDLFLIFKERLTAFDEEQVCRFTNQYIDKNSLNDGEFISFKINRGIIFIIFIKH
jgi:hypothetical protein